METKAPVILQMNAILTHGGNPGTPKTDARIGSRPGFLELWQCVCCTQRLTKASARARGSAGWCAIRPKVLGRCPGPRIQSARHAHTRPHIRVPPTISMSFQSLAKGNLHRSWPYSDTNAHN